MAHTKMATKNLHPLAAMHINLKSAGPFETLLPYSLPSHTPLTPSLPSHVVSAAATSSGSFTIVLQITSPIFPPRGWYASRSARRQYYIGASTLFPATGNFSRGPLQRQIQKPNLLSTPVSPDNIQTPAPSETPTLGHLRLCPSLTAQRKIPLVVDSANELC